MVIESLMDKLANIMGGKSKHKGDFWILEVPMGKDGNCTVFFRLNTFNTDFGTERLLVFINQIGRNKHTDSSSKIKQLEYLLKANLDFRFSKISIIGDKIALISAAHEDTSENILLEMIHEVVHVGMKLKKEL